MATVKSFLPALAFAVTILVGGVVNLDSALWRIFSGHEKPDAEGIPPDSLRVAVEFSDRRLLSELGGVACTTWINSMSHVIIYSDSYTRENLPVDSEVIKKCGKHVVFVSITNMTVDSNGRQTNLGSSIELAQLKREVIVKDMARRMMMASPQTWALLTEEDTWWKGKRLFQLLHRVEKDLGFNRTNANAELPPILTGAGHVEGVDDDIAYGPMMLMSKSLLTQLAARLDQCRTIVAHSCLERHNSVPLALQHPNSTNSSNVFVPDYVLEMSAKASADKTLVKCQDNYPPECSALCARRMDTYDGAIYNNDHFISMCSHLVPGIKSAVVRTLQPHGYAFYGDQGIVLDDYVSEVHPLVTTHNCKAKCIYGSASGHGPMMQSSEAQSSSCSGRVQWLKSEGFSRADAIDQVNTQCIGQCFCIGGSKNTETQIEMALLKRRNEAIEARNDRLKRAERGDNGQRFFLMQNYNEKGLMTTVQPEDVPQRHLALTVAYHKCYETCQTFLSKYKFDGEARRETPVQSFLSRVRHPSQWFAKARVDGEAFSPAKKTPFVCRVGKDNEEYQVPTVYLAGVQKSATSTLFWQMVSEYKFKARPIAYGEPFDDEPQYIAKEKHFFDFFKMESDNEYQQALPDIVNATKPPLNVYQHALPDIANATKPPLNVSWVLDKAWFEKRIRQDAARARREQQSQTSGDVVNSSITSCCPAAQQIYGYDSANAKSRCCTEKLHSISPLRPLGGSSWKSFAKSCQSGALASSGRCSMLIVGDSMAQQHFISIVCLAWAETGQEIKLTRHKPPEGALLDKGVGVFDASNWTAVVAPYGITVSFSRRNHPANHPQVPDLIDYSQHDFVLLSAWHHGAVTDAKINNFTQGVAEARRFHPASHTVLLEKTPTHFPGGKYLANGSYPPAEDHGSCDMNSSNDYFLLRSRGDAHPGGLTYKGSNNPRSWGSTRDCLHWCVAPGVLDGMGLSVLARLKSILEEEKLRSRLLVSGNRGLLAKESPQLAKKATPLRFMQHFPKCSEEKQILVDGTPNYLFVPQAAPLMLQFYGEQFSKLRTIIMLRNPTARFESYFFHARRQGFLDGSVLSKATGNMDVISFTEYTVLSLAKAHRCLENKPWEALWPMCGTEGIFSGLYAPQLSHWLEYFNPWQVAIVSTSAFEFNNTQVMTELAMYLGVDHVPPRNGAPFVRKNRGEQQHEKNATNEEDARTLKKLDEFYANDTILTRELIRTSTGLRIVPERGGWGQF